MLDVRSGSKVDIGPTRLKNLYDYSRLGIVQHPDNSVRSKIMSLGKQAKHLSKAQIEAALGYLARTRYPIRNQLIFLLSIKAGLRAREIALLTWSMVTDAEGRIGRVIVLENAASKGRSGRAVPINNELRRALIAWHDLAHPAASSCVISTERSKQASPQVIVNMFARWYEQVLKSQRAANLHLERCEEDFAGWWLFAGCANARRPQQLAYHATLYRGECRGTEPDRPVDLEAIWKNKLEERAFSTFLV